MITGSGVSAVQPYDELRVNIDGGGSPISVGPSRAYYLVASPGLVVGWTLAGDVSGELVVDVQRKYLGLPTPSDSIVGSTPPKLQNEAYKTTEPVVGWDTKLKQGDILHVDITSCVGVTQAILTLKVLRT